MNTPCSFRPNDGDFIGPARDLLRRLQGIALRSKSTGEPIKLLLQGDPGVGKSSLAGRFIECIGANKWTTTKLNGTELTVEEISEWAGRLAYREIYGDYRVLWLEEVDKVNKTVQTRLLTVLDDLPDHVAVVCTSNKDLSAFEPRFQSRFQTLVVKSPAVEEIKTLLARWPLNETDIVRIAHFCCGNVRLALFDAQNALDGIL